LAISDEPQGVAPPPPDAPYGDSYNLRNLGAPILVLGGSLTMANMFTTTVTVQGGSLTTYNCGFFNQVDVTDGTVAFHGGLLPLTYYTEGNFVVPPSTATSVTCAINLMGQNGGSAEVDGVLIGADNGVCNNSNGCGSGTDGSEREVAPEFGGQVFVANRVLRVGRAVRG
jgi:hypothetical protein